MSTTKNIPYMIKSNGPITLYLGGECMTIAIDHPNYSKVIDALKKQEFDKISALIDIGKAVTQYSKGQVTIKDGQVFYGSFPLHNTLTKRILAMLSEGFKFEHMLKFLENLMQNPSNRAVNETYTFLENYGLPITDDGCFLAYKAVRNDYKDIYSGTLDNRVGCAPSMPRNMVDETYERDCSTGLHVGALDYVVQYGHFVKGAALNENGNRLLIVKVNPKDVVSVPQYSGHPKMRVSQYFVVSEIKDIVKELDKVIYTSNAEVFSPDSDGYTDEEDAEEKDHDAEECNDESCDCGFCRSSPVSAADESEYTAGYKLGQSDCTSGREFRESVDANASDLFNDGYADGYSDSDQ